MDEFDLVGQHLTGPKPSRQTVMDGRRRLNAAIGQAARGPAGGVRPIRGRLLARLSLVRVGVSAAVAGAAAVAVALSVAPSPQPGRHPAAGGLRSSPATGKANVPSAQAVLLAAATSAAKQAPPAMGKYWRVATTSMTIVVAGSKAHPYDMAAMSRRDDASARVAGQPLKWVSQDLGATPATSRDAAAWRADGSPSHGRDRILAPGAGGKVKVIFYPVFAPGAPVVSQMPNQDGAVADAVGDGSPLTTRQLAAFPADPAKLKALMTSYVNYDYRGAGGVGTATAGSMDQNLMTEAINLLQAPLPPPVESAVYRVMAGLPGSRTLGLMRDPLGRSGYAIAYAGQYSLPALPHGMQVQPVLIVDPSSGTLLATEALVTTPGTATVRYTPCRTGNRVPGCIQPTSYGTRHQGQLWSYTVIKAAAWTNTLPPG